MQGAALLACKLRIEHPGAIYHVMSRGNHGKWIFRAQGDRELLLKTLGQACERTGWLIHAFVLMGNHYHLPLALDNLVESVDGLFEFDVFDSADPPPEPFRR